MRRISERVRRGMSGASTQFGHLRSAGVVTKLFVQAGGVQVKIEVTPVLRGCVYGHVRRAVSPAVEDAYGYAEARGSSPLTTSSPARWLRPSTDSIPETFSMSVRCSPTKALRTRSGRHSSSI